MLMLDVVMHLVERMKKMNKKKVDKLLIQLKRLLILLMLSNIKKHRLANLSKEFLNNSLIIIFYIYKDTIHILKDTWKKSKNIWPKSIQIEYNHLWNQLPNWLNLFLEILTNSHFMYQSHMIWIIILYFHTGKMKRQTQLQHLFILWMDLRKLNSEYKNKILKVVWLYV